jgi:hypothetical protein
MDGGGVERDDEKNGERSGWKWEEAQHLGFWLVRCARFCSSISCVYFLCVSDSGWLNDWRDKGFI